MRLTRLEFGDMAFMGRGPCDMPVMIGVERKALSDLANSMVSGRFSGHQLPGLQNSYSSVYLIVEGLWRPNSNDGILEEYRRGEWRALEYGNRRFMAKEIYGFLNSLSLRVGVNVWRTGTKQETVAVVMALRHWWVDKKWEDHKSHAGLHVGRWGMEEGEGGVEFELGVSKPSLARRVAKELPGIGWKRSRYVAKGFGDSTWEMIMAGEEEWGRIKGIGKKVAERVVRAIREGK